MREIKNSPRLKANYTKKKRFTSPFHYQISATHLCYINFKQDFQIKLTEKNKIKSKNKTQEKMTEG